METQNIDTLILGAGLSGLTSAWKHEKSGKKVVVLEKSERIGGAIRSEMKDGFLIEAGPNSMLVKSEEVWDFLEEIGLRERHQLANEDAGKRYLVKRSKVTAVPGGILGGMVTPLYSLPAKFRLLKEPFVKTCPKDDESVASFVSRRMGPQFLEYGIAPLVSGIFAGNPDQLSIKYGFPKVWNLEQNYGSLIGGAMKLKKERKKKGLTPFKSKMLSFPNGLIELPQQIIESGGFEVKTEAKVFKIEQENDHWIVHYKHPSGVEVLKTKSLISTIPIHAVSKLPLPESLLEAFEEVPTLEHPPVSTLMLGFHKDQIKHALDGFGVLVPRLEKRKILGTIFSSSLFPNRAPEDHVNLMTFIGGSMQPKLAGLATNELIQMVLQELGHLLGVEGEPVFSSHSYWDQAIPQYNVGHGIFLQKLEKLEWEFPGLQIRGNFRGGPGLNDCIATELEEDI